MAFCWCVDVVEEQNRRPYDRRDDRHRRPSTRSKKKKNETRPFFLALTLQDSLNECDMS